MIASNGEGAQLDLPGLARARELAAQGGRPFFTDGTVQKTHVRVYTAQIGDGLAVQAVRTLGEVDHTLNQLGLYMLFIGLTGVAIAGGLGMLVATAALRPISTLTAVAEEVADTRDLSRRIEVATEDELGRLASAFNAMLGALEASVKAQRRLVADASHELRTPLSSLRTNIEVLVGGKKLVDDEREKLLADVIGEVEELSTLVGDLVEIDRDRPAELEDVRLDELVASAVERAKVRTPKVLFRTTLEESAIRGAPGPARPRRLQPARQRREVEQLRGRRRVGYGCDRPRPRTGHRRGRSPLRLRPLLPCRERAQPARLGARARDRQAGRARARRRGHRGERRGRRRLVPDPPAGDRRHRRSLRLFSGRRERMRP